MFNLNSNQYLNLQQHKASEGGNDFYLCSSNCSWPVMIAWPHPYMKIKCVYQALTCYHWFPTTNKVQIWETLYCIVCVQIRSMMKISFIAQSQLLCKTPTSPKKRQFFLVPDFLSVGTHSTDVSVSKGRVKRGSSKFQAIEKCMQLYCWFSLVIIVQTLM